MDKITMLPAQTGPALQMAKSGPVLKEAENSYYGKLRAPRTSDTPEAKIDPSTIKNYKQIVEKAQEFEAVFLSEMMKPMFESVDVDPLFGGGNSEEIFRGMQVQEYGKQIAGTKGIGLADFVKRELIRVQQNTQDGAKNDGR